MNYYIITIIMLLNEHDYTSYKFVLKIDLFKLKVNLSNSFQL